MTTDIERQFAAAGIPWTPQVAAAFASLSKTLVDVAAVVRMVIDDMRPTFNFEQFRAALDKVEREDRARRRFRRTMRRLADRAERVGLVSCALTLRAWRRTPEHGLRNEEHARRTAREIHARRGTAPLHERAALPTWAYLYERAADAVARLRAEVS